MIWVECERDGFLHEELLCGVRVKQHRSWTIEKTRRYDKSVHPELWIAQDWPDIPIGSEETGISGWTFDPAVTLPLEALIRKTGRPGLSDESGAPSNNTNAS